ncbi:MAG: glycosyltransferase [Devosia sp.]|nr:glycosyltransferase [Devosia sp.]
MRRKHRAADVTAIVLTTGEATTASAIACIRGQDAPVFDIVVVRDIHPFHKALNQGASLVTTPYFVQVDADMLLDPDCIGALRRAMRSDVGIAVGRLRDAMMGTVVGVKLFRKACFEVAMFPDSISPDTDFVEAIGQAGWRTVYVGNQHDRGKHGPRTFGVHAPEYQPHYVFRKFLMEGQRYYHRSALGGLRWQLAQLTRSSHPNAVLARVALAAGFLDAPAGDALGRETPSGFDSVVAALASSDRPSGAASAKRARGTLRDCFFAEWQRGRNAAEQSDARIFREALESLERLPDDELSLLLKLGLCRGFVTGGDPQRDFDRLEKFFRQTGQPQAATAVEQPELPLAEVFEYARQVGLERFVMAPSVGMEFVYSAGSFRGTSPVANRTDAAGRPRIDVPFRLFGSIVCTDAERVTGLFWCLDLLRRGYLQAHVPGPFGAHRVSLPGALLDGLLDRVRAGKSGMQQSLPMRFIRRMLAPPLRPYQATEGRVLMVAESLGRGGAERQLLAVAEGLQRRGYDVKVLSFADFDAGVPSYEGDLRRLGIEVTHGMGEPSTSRRYLPSTPGCVRPEDAARLPRWMRDRMAALSRLLVTWGPEVVHAWGDGPGSAALLAAGTRGVRQIVVQQGSMAIFRRGHPGSALIRNVYAVLAGRAGVTMINNSLAGALDNEQWIGLPRGSVGVRYNGLLPGTVRPVSAEETAQYKASLGWSADTPVVGTITRIVAVKDPDLWLATAARIREQRPDVRFLFAGYGPLAEATKANAARLGIGDRIHFAGAVEDVGLVYSAIDVVLLTSAIEGVPNVMIEAQAAGRPVVAPDVGGAAEALAEGVTGLIARPRDVLHLASAVIRLLDDDAWRARLRQDGPRLVAERFDLDAMVEKTIEHYGIARPGPISA